MFDRVVRALRTSRVSPIYAVTSLHTPETRAHASDRGLDVVHAPGEGYVADLQYALDAVGTPALTVVADLPFLRPAHVDRALSDAYDGGENGEGVRSLTVCVPADLKRRVGVSVDTTFEYQGRQVAPTGLNVVGGEGVETETVSVVDDERLAVNVNRPTDREVAEARCD